MKHCARLLTTSLLLLLAARLAAAQTTVSFPLPQVIEPSLPSRSVNITDYGAVSDGQTLNTAAFEAAIAAVSAEGGGRVVVPPGLWRTGPIVLRSRVELHVQRGALVQFSDNRDDYPLIETSYEGRSSWRCQSPLFGRDLEDVAITGDGILDGAGQVWRPVKKTKLTERQWSDLLASGGVVNPRGDVWYPSEASLAGNEGGGRGRGSGLEGLRAIKDALRPVMLSMVECTNVLLEGVTFQNSPAWCLHPLMCENLTLRRVTVRNPWYSQNGDGLDLESCRNARVEECAFDVGDDAICLKSGRDAEGRRRGRPTENVIVTNCVVYHGHGGFVVGSEMSGGVRNIRVSDCTFIGTDVGLRFKSTRGRGGVVENILIEGIRMTDIPTEAIRFNLFYGGAAPTESDIPSASGGAIPPVTEETPAFRNIVMRDIICRGAQRAALLQGLPEMPLENVRMEDVTISANEGILVGDATRLDLLHVRLKVRNGPALSMRDASEVTVQRFEAEGGSRPLVRVSGARTKAIRLLQSALKPDELSVASNVPADAVQLEQ